MSEEIKWCVGKEGTAHTRLDLPPYRAYFYWFRDGVLIDSSDFDIQELELEIQRRCAAGEETAPFEHALKALQK